MDDNRQIGIEPPGPGLPDDTRLGPVCLQVADHQQSLAFYESVLGLRVLDSIGNRIVLGPKGEDVPLVELVEQPGAHPVAPRERLGLFHVAFLLPDRSALGRFVRHLTDVDVRPGMSDHGVSEAVYLRDPDGLGIEVYAGRPRSTWTVSERGEINMVTEPLDVQSLVGIETGASWSGMPAGTTVGHVHLHVGDLDRAEVFYHEALRFDKVVWSYPGALFLSAGGYHHHLGTNVWAGDAPPPEEDEAQLLEWTLLLPTHGDVQAEADRLESGEYEVTQDEGDPVVDDPWGTRLRICTGHER